MKMGIGIGWPNSTSGSGGVYTFIILNCNDASRTVYSVSSQFLPSAYMFNDLALTSPFANDGIWNLPELIYSIGGYEMDLSGEIKNPLLTCPA